MDKTERAYVIFTTMTRHHMALRIVELEDESAAAIEAMNMAREVIDEGTAKLEEYNAKLADYDKRITELQDALELAEEAVRAKHVPDIAKMVVPEGWQLLPVVATREMIDAAMLVDEDGYAAMHSAMLAAAPKL